MPGLGLGSGGLGLQILQARARALGAGPEALSPGPSLGFFIAKKKYHARLILFISYITLSGNVMAVARLIGSPGLPGMAGLAFFKPEPWARQSPVPGSARLVQARARLGSACGPRPSPEHHYRHISDENYEETLDGKRKDGDPRGGNGI
ncbi:hypothetical protein C8R45DRAFT_940575 [Mycena sanguinolenta]|nr:hypothetical protein C8R45DRAFT_940575 [Mycena sanguinolenta]